MITLEIRDAVECALRNDGKISPQDARFLTQTYSLWDLHGKLLGMHTLNPSQRDYESMAPYLQPLIDGLPNSLLLIRGLPGSGKSTMAKIIQNSIEYPWAAFVHLENDMFRMQDETYVWEPGRDQAVHMSCLGATFAELQSGHNIVVSNTFCLRASIQDYVEIAQECGAYLTVSEASGTWTSTHNVPKQTLDHMRSHWEPWP